MEYKKWKYPGVRKNSAGNWEISFFPFKGAKNKTYITLSSEDHTEYQAKLRRGEEIVKARQQNQMPEEQRTLLSADFNKARQDMLDVLLNKEGQPLPKKTRQKYEKVFDRMFVDFRRLKYPSLNSPRQLSLRFVEEYKGYYCGEKGLNRSNGWRAEVIIIKAILKRLYKLGYVTPELILSVREEITRPKSNKKRYYELTDTQMKSILDYMKKDRADFWDLARFMYMTGRRVEECTLIERSDIRWQGIKLEQINIRSETTKTKEDAPIIIHKDLEEIVRHAYTNSIKHKSPYLFLNRKHKKINQRQFNVYLKKVSKEMTGIGITTHYFRKRFMTECQKRGVTIKDAMSVCGLKDKEVALEYYSYPTKEGQQKALEAMSLK